MAPASPQFTTVQTAQLSAFPLSFLLPIYSLLEAVAFNSFDISFRTSWVAVHLVCVISKMKVEVRFIYWFCFRFPCVCPGKWQPGSCVYAGHGWKCVVSLTVLLNISYRVEPFLEKEFSKWLSLLQRVILRDANYILHYGHRAGHCHKALWQCRELPLVRGGWSALIEPYCKALH